MEFTLRAQVNCTDGRIGETVRLVVNPVTMDVTHLTVRADGIGESEHLLPVTAVDESKDGVLTLSLSKQQFFLLPLFYEHRFVDMDAAGVAPENIAALPEAQPAMGHAFWPFVTAEGHLGEYVETQQIPPGELTIHRGAEVEASDGRVGTVSRLAVKRDGGHITHMVLRKSQLFGHRDIAVPVADIDHVDEGIVYLKINKDAVGNLPVLDINN